MTEQQQSHNNILPEIEQQPSDQEKKSAINRIGLIVVAVLVAAALIAGLVLLLQPGTNTAKIRDLFIIFMALEFLMIGLVLIVLIVQLAKLIYLLQNEVQPILESSRETAETLRGTSAFLSETLVEPVLKLNEYLAGLNRILRFFRSDKK